MFIQSVRAHVFLTSATVMLWLIASLILGAALGSAVAALVFALCGLHFAKLCSHIHLTRGELRVLDRHFALNSLLTGAAAYVWAFHQETLISGTGPLLAAVTVFCLAVFIQEAAKVLVLGLGQTKLQRQIAN